MNLFLATLVKSLFIQQLLKKMRKLCEIKPEIKDGVWTCWQKERSDKYGCSLSMDMKNYLLFLKYYRHEIQNTCNFFAWKSNFFMFFSIIDIKY